MTPSYPVVTKDLNYLLDLVRQYRAEAEAARKAAGSDDPTFHHQFGQALAYARIEGHIEGILTVNEICAK